MSIFGETAKKNLGTFGESTKKNLDSFSETAKKNLDSLVSTVSTASVSVSNTVASSARTASIRLTGVANDSGKAAIGVKESDSDLFNNSPSNGGGSPHTSNASSLSSNKISITPPTIPNKFSSKVSKKVGKYTLYFYYILSILFNYL